jgi:high-affinity iron transporter
MLGSAVIIFREVLEAALIIGLILAVTHDVAGRMRFVIIGLGAGLSGAVLLALLGDWVAPLAQGIGQELLNAGILLTAVVMLTWHLVWMKKHSQSISRDIKQIGSKIEAGEQETSIIAVIIGLAVLREGSEAVLFMFGLSAAGSSLTSLLLGSLLGLLAGVTAGAVVYFSLARVPLSQLFRVSGWLILLLTAGLAAQASFYLVQADILPALGNQIWDTSNILSEKSLLGQFLHIIVGYVAQPMGIQIVFYVTTIIVVLALTYLVANPLSRNTLRASTISGVSLLFGAMFMFSGNEAYASHKIYGPHVEEGEFELEVRTHTTFDKDASKNSKQKTKIEAGYGVSQNWFTAIGGVYATNSNGE